MAQARPIPNASRTETASAACDSTVNGGAASEGGVPRWVSRIVEKRPSSSAAHSPM